MGLNGILPLFCATVKLLLPQNQVYCLKPQNKAPKITAINLHSHFIKPSKIGDRENLTLGNSLKENKKIEIIPEYITQKIHIKSSLAI